MSADTLQSSVAWFRYCYLGVHLKRPVLLRLSIATYLTGMSPRDVHALGTVVMDNGNG
jgi:hypothetical protein